MYDLIGLINNVNAHGNKASMGKARKLEAMFNRSGNGLFRSPKDHRRSLDDVVSEFITRNVNIVISNGGDGTFHHILNSYIKIIGCDNPLPRFVILSSGTANVLSKYINKKNKPEKAVERILYGGVEDISSIAVRTLYVNADDEDRFGFTFGSGAISHFLKDYEDESLGEKESKKALKMILKGIFNRDYASSIVKETRADIYIDEHHRKSQYTAVLVSAFKPQIIGLRPFDFMGETDYGVYSAHTDLGRKGLIRAIPLLILGREINDVEYSSGVNELRIISDEEISYTVDGELFSGRNITVNQGPEIEVIKI